MLRKMGMKVDEDQLKGLLEQFRDKFDAMGIDEEKLARGRSKFQFRHARLFQILRLRHVI